MVFYSSAVSAESTTRKENYLRRDIYPHPMLWEGFSLTKLAPLFTPTPKSKPLNFR